MVFKNKIALVVDDSVTIRHQIKILLRKHNISVLEAHDRKSMMNNLSVNNKLVDIIIMDLGLKDTTGFDLMDSLREDPRYAKIPIIVLTGDSTKAAVLTAARFKIAFYAVKPINPNDLVSKIMTTLEASEAKDHDQAQPRKDDDFDVFADIELDLDEQVDKTKSRYFMLDKKNKK